MGSCNRVDKRLLPVKFHYFLFMAGLACALPFRTIFAKQLGISATAVGVIFCVVPFLKTVTNPLFGFIFDYFKRFRLILSVIMVFVAVFHVAMIFIPSKATMSNDGINVTVKSFYSEIRYSCFNESFSNDYDRYLLMYNEYSMTNISGRGEIGFTCDIQCSDVTNVMAVQSKANTSQCSEKMSFELKVLVDTSNCDMDVRLQTGKIFVIAEDVENPVLVNINESTFTQLRSWTAPVGNCSVEILKKSDKLTEKDPDKTKETINEWSQLEEKNISEPFNYVKRISSQSASLDHEGKKQYFAYHKYKIKLQAENTFLNRPCKLDFKCQTKKCSHNVHKGEVDSKKFVDDGNEFLSAQFWGLFMLIALSSLMFSAIMFMMDAVCYEMLQDKREKYGQQRLWGTIGWGIGALAGGYLNQAVTADSEQVDYAPSFYLLAVLTLIDLIPVYHLKVTEVKYSSHICKDVCFLFSKLDIVYNVVVVYLIGVLSGFIWNYQFWFLEEIGSSQVLLGLSQTFECLFELPCFLMSGWIIKKIGHDHCNNVTFLCFGLRYLCFVFMYDPWWTLATGFFHGPTFGVFYASMTMYAKNEAPPGTEATVQSLLHLCFEGIGVATGSVLGGIGLDKFGSRVSFMYAAEMSFLLLFVNILMGILFSRTKRNSIKIQDPVSSP